MKSRRIHSILLVCLVIVAGFVSLTGCVNEEKPSNNGGAGGNTGGGTNGGENQQGEEQGGEENTPQLNLDEVNSFFDLLTLAKGMSYRWEDSEETWGEANYIVIGEETINGVECWKINLSYSSSDSSEVTSAIVWISKSDGTSLQIEMPGVGTYSGPMVENFWPTISSAILIPFTTWTYYEMTNPPPDVGTVTYIGSEERTYGEATLTVLTYRFTPAPSNPEYKDVSYTEVSGSILDSNHGLLVGINVEYKDGTWWKWNLQTVTLW